jgi:hypothetical protein
MSVMAKSVGRSKGNPSSGNRQKLVLVGLLVVLAVVLAVELPGMLGGSSSSSSSPSATSTTASGTSASAPTSTTPAAAAVKPATKVSAATRTERYIKRLPARDPFVPLAGATAAAAPAAPVVAAPAPAPTPAPKPAPAPKLVPTSAVIWTNGTRQVVALKQLFRVGDTSFRLLSVGKNSVKVAVAVGGFKNGAKTITIAKNKPVTIQNTITGAQYNLRFTLAMTAVGGR